MSTSKETYVISLKDKQFLQGLVNAQNATDRTRGKVSSLSGAVGHLKSALAGVSIAFLGREIIQTLANFERFDAVLTNTLGSGSSAKIAMEEIVEFASNTPFAVDELTGAFVKLANRGFAPTSKEMRKMGDLASSTGKGFDQLVEGVLDAQTGEFERLKEFGITARKSGDNVAFSFKGVTTNVKFTQGAIKDYILSLGELKGVSGAMEAINKTTGGALSNLGDSVTLLYLKIGKSLNTEIGATIALLKTTVESLGDFVIWLKKGGDDVDILAIAIAAVTSGLIAYKTQLILATAWTKITSLAQLALAAASAFTGTSLVGASVAMKIFTVAQWAMNVALTANPIGAIVLLLAALIGGLVMAWNRSETFRGVILGTWEALKVLGSFIYSFFEPAVKAVGKAFVWVKDQVVEKFGIVKKVVMDTINSIMNYLRPVIDFFSNAVDSMTDNLTVKNSSTLVNLAKSMGSAFGSAVDKEINDAQAGTYKFDLLNAPKDTKEYDRFGQLRTKKVAGASNNSNKKSKIGAGLSEIKSSAPKTFNINIGSLIKDQIIQTTNLTESKGKVKEAMINALLTAVTDAQVIAE